LDTLQEVFRNKKFSYTWSEQVIEPIMFKYLDLCVELKKSHIAKEGLFQYRNMFQLVSEEKPTPWVISYISSQSR
jgi:translation initiation factor 3 subunit A